MICGGERQITNKDFHGEPSERGGKRSPGHPNSLQTPYRGEAARHVTGSSRDVLPSPMLSSTMPGRNAPRYVLWSCDNTHNLYCALLFSGKWKWASRARKCWAEAMVLCPAPPSSPVFCRVSLWQTTCPPMATTCPRHRHFVREVARCVDWPHGVRACQTWQRLWTTVWHASCYAGSQVSRSRHLAAPSSTAVKAPRV